MKKNDFDDLYFMNEALKEAKTAFELDEVLVGAIIVCNNKIIARAHNYTEALSDATAHAEIQLIRAAGKKQENYRLTGTSLYVTLEPCAMCLGAMMHARIERIIYGTHDPKTGACGSSENLIDANCFNHKIDLVSGVLENECKQLLKKFFISCR